ncbi:MAG: hypothetical protein ACO3C2_01540 [Candidatus Nanopelagicales bacterium]
MMGIYFFPKRLHARLLAARDLNTPPTILGALAADPVEEVRLGVAGNPKTPKGVWTLLLNDQNSMVRSEIAARYDLDQESILKLANDKSENVCKELSCRDDLNDEVLRILVNKSLPIRIQLASKSNKFPDWLSVKLAKDVESRVRVLVSASTKSETAINILRNDQDWAVQDSLASREFNQEISEMRKKFDFRSRFRQERAKDHI